MTFTEHLVSTFLGSVFGFLFSIVLFYLNNKLAKDRERKTLEKNLAKELDFNIIFLERLLEDVKKVIEKVMVEDRDTKTFYFRYSNFQRLFLSAYFREGYMYEKFSSADINILDIILTHQSLTGENYINNAVQRWQNSELDPIEALKIFSLERNLITQNKNALINCKGILFSPNKQ